jgi:hypothetical protein
MVGVDAQPSGKRRDGALALPLRGLQHGLRRRETFAQYAKLPIADPTTHTLALYCFSVSTRDEVDAVCAAALAAGGTEADGAEDHGFMYSRSFFDLDGHGWQVMWMDPAAQALAASTGDAGARA